MLRILGSASLCALVACSSVDRVEVSPAAFALYKQGASQALKITARDSDGSKIEKPSTSFKIADPTIATVDDSGTVTAVKTGDTTLTATVGGISSAIPVKVSIPATITCSPPTIQFEGAGGAITLAAKLVDEKGREIEVAHGSTRTRAGKDFPGGAVTWASSNSSVADTEHRGCEAGVPCNRDEVVAKAVGETEMSGTVAGLRCSVKVKVIAAAPVSIPTDEKLDSKPGSAPGKHGAATPAKGKKSAPGSRPPSSTK
jgi:uncharacterized protein YjdB